MVHLLRRRACHSQAQPTLSSIESAHFRSIFPRAFGVIAFHPLSAVAADAEAKAKATSVASISGNEAISPVEGLVRFKVLLVLELSHSPLI